MVQPVIIETNTRQEAWDKQVEYHLARVTEYQSLSYPIVYAGDPGYEMVNVIVGYDGFGEETVVIRQNLPNGSPGIVPLANGVPNYSAQPTWTWAAVRSTPDGTYAFPIATDVSPELSGTLTQDYGLYPRPEEWDALDYDTHTFTAGFDKASFK